MISHPNWGTRNYPATVFARAPVDVVVRVLAESGRECEGVSVNEGEGMLGR